MATIKYTINGKDIDVEVTQEFARAFEQLKEEEKNNERRETRRHLSLEALTEEGFQVEDPKADIEDQLYKKLENNALFSAIKSLDPNQKWLIEQVFFLNRTQQDIAEELGVNRQIIHNKVSRILKKLKIFLQKNVYICVFRG